MNEFYDVIILDSKIHKKFFCADSNLQVMPDDPLFENNDIISHGDMVYHVLTSKLSKCVTCLNIDITDDSALDLLNALKYILDKNIKCKVISISAGIDCCDAIYRRQLYQACTELASKNVIIVSGFSNMGRIVYPAAFDCVIGVDMSVMCKNINDFEVINSSTIVNIRGTCLPQVLHINNTSISCAGTSFVVPLVVAIITNKNLVTQKDVMNYFQTIAKVFVTPKKLPTTNRLFEIQNAIAFPFNKEIQNLYINKDLLKFKIIGYYEHKSRLRNNITNMHNYKSICWNDDFDTVILGHIQELSAALKENLIAYFVNLIISHKKKAIFFDNIPTEAKQLLDNAGIEYFLASKNDIPNYSDRFGKLRYLSIPIIGIFGTSPKQGKFTLQLKLYREFAKLGYNVGLLGTEPISKLLGAEESVICGYGSEIQNSNELVFDVNEKLFQIEEKQKDIAIISSQSQTIPAGFGNVSMYPLYQESILLGSLPDGIILCVNHSDSTHYIKRTINYIQSLVDTEVIAIILFVFEYKNFKYERKSKEEIGDKKSELEGMLNIPVFCSDDSANDIVALIVDYLKEGE